MRNLLIVSEIEGTNFDEELIIVSEIEGTNFYEELIVSEI